MTKLILVLMMFSAPAFAVTASDLEEWGPEYTTLSTKRPAAKDLEVESVKKERPLTRCPDGTYVRGRCTKAPDGSYVGD